VVQQRVAKQGLVLVAVEQGIARVTLNRPDRLNALNHELAEELADSFDRLTQDLTLRVVTLMGAGRAFMAGATWQCSGRPARTPPKSSAG